MILRPRRLADALAAGRLSERDKLSYLLVWPVVGTAAEYYRASVQSWSQPQMAFVAAAVLISILGLLVCFRANVQGDNRSFLERYVCLSVPIGAVTYAVFFGGYYAMGLVGLLGGWVEPDASNWNADLMGAVSSVAAMGLFFLWMRSAIGRAAGSAT